MIQELFVSDHSTNARERALRTQNEWGRRECVNRAFREVIDHRDDNSLRSCASILFTVVSGLKRCVETPQGEIRNFVKFHLIFVLLNRPGDSALRSLYRGCASGPLTRSLRVNGK